AAAGDHDHPHRGFRVRALERLGQLGDDLGRKRIARLRPVDGQERRAARSLVLDLSFFHSASSAVALVCPPTPRRKISATCVFAASSASSFFLSNMPTTNPVRASSTAP